MEPACAKACPTDSIQFGPLDELRERADAAGRASCTTQGVDDARLYGDDPDDGVGGAGAFFLLLDEPEVYGLPPDPVVTTRDLPAMWRQVGPPPPRCWRVSPPLPSGGSREQRVAGDPRGAAGPGAGTAGGPDYSTRRKRSRRASSRWCRTRSSRSYYGMPVLNRPVWAEPDIAGYLFLGGLAGASSAMAAAADLRGRARSVPGEQARCLRGRRPLAGRARARPRAARPGSSTCCGCSR